MLDPIGEKAFVTDDSRLLERAVHAGWQKVFVQSGQGGRVRSSKQKGRDRQIQLIDQILFEQRAKKGGASFAGHRADFVFGAEALQHPRQIDMARLAQLERRLLP